MIRNKIRKSRRKKSYEILLAAFLTVCMIVTGIPFGSLQVYAENTATVVNVYATISDTGEPSDYEVAEEGQQTAGKVLYGKVVRNGSYSVTAEDAELFLLVDNAAVTYPQGCEVDPYQMKLSGVSSLKTDTYTVSSNSTAYSAESITNENIDDFIQYYDNQPPYAFNFTADTTWTSWLMMDTLTVDNGVTLTIAHGSNDEGEVASAIETKHAVINGTVVIEGNEIEHSNTLSIDGEGSLTAGANSIIGSGNANLAIRENVTVSGMILYDYFDEGSDSWIEYTCDGTNSECTWFFYDVGAGKWVRIQDGGDSGTLPNNKYRILKIGGGEQSLTVDGESSEFDDRNAERDFINGTPINFTITGDVYKVVVALSDSENEIDGNNGSYSYTPESDGGFEILVYTSQEEYEYDRCRPNSEEGEFAVEYQTRYQDEEAAGVGNGVTIDSEQLGSNLVNQVTVGEWTKLILKNTDRVPLTITVADGYKYNVIMHEAEDDVDVTEEVQSNSNVLSWDVTAGDGSARPEIYFEKAETSGSGTEDSSDLKSYIEDLQFAFGDWDEDGDVDGDDIKLGMAYQIFYPKLEQNRDWQEEYQIPDYNSLISMITVTEALEQNLVAKDADGVNRTIPAYSYIVDLTKGAGESEENIQATGTAYAFDFADGSKYQDNSRGCVIAVTEKDGVKSYFLRCVNAYKDGTTSDNTPMVAGENPNESPIVIVSDFDVIYNSQDSTYDRKVSIFGNGAGLDALLSREEDMDVVAYQGRNEDFMNAIGKSQSWGVIFSIFTFCQESLVGVQVKGTGASGNTPSWAFNQFPVFSTDDSENTEKEAIVYFGNSDVTIKPIDNLAGLDDSVTGIASMELADSNISTAAVEITRQSATEWKVIFHSDFYDQVKVKIIYDLQGGSTKTSYLNIHRVGIDILTGDGRTGMTLFHGTENGPTYNATGELVIWGTYYYPQVASGAELVDLYVTYTWSDGSTTKRTIHNAPSLNMEYHHDGTNDCQSSDFILYDGSRAGAPIKIEAIAVVNGFDNTATFGGAKFGAGKGVVWNNYLGN